MLTAHDILIGLEVAVFIMLIIVLYHALFIAVDLRKIVRRIEDITAQLEDVLLKPISLVEHIMEYAAEFFDEKSKKEKHSKKAVKASKKSS